MTIARTHSGTDSRWYARDGTPQYEVNGKTTGRPRPVTIADARKNGWLPSVTTVLKCLAKPGLEDWKTEMACLAVLTAPRIDGEALDAFVHRVLHVEQQQNQEAAKARDLGTEIHDAMEHALKGDSIPGDMAIYVDPALEKLKQFGIVTGTEQIVVGDGYAGKLDAIFQGNRITIMDFKSAKTLPKSGSWLEHRLQLGAYAQAIDKSAEHNTDIQTANLYISTSEPGKVHLDIHADWWSAYRDGFLPLLWFWQYANDYKTTK